jgi:hypothetical protein
LASELLLSDEDSLKNLSAQVLNEAKHLTQLNCVLSTLNKIRTKYLKNGGNGCLEQLCDSEKGSQLVVFNIESAPVENASGNGIGFISESNNINYILEGIIASASIFF